jgi:tetratricopeptide (TPR) repeat protein
MRATYKTILALGLALTAVIALPLPAQDSPAKSETQLWHQDLRFMAEEMPKRHKNLFHTMTRAQFDAAVRSLDARIPSLARHQVIVEMARIVAMVGDGHTNIAPTRDPKIGFRTLPIALHLFQDGLYVRAAARTHADLVGSRVLRIGNAPADQAYRSARELIGRDNEMDVKFFAPLLLVMPEVLHALGLIENVESARFVVESHGKQRAVILTPAGPAEMMAPDTDVSWAPRENFVDARDGATQPLPLWLRDPKNKYWFEYLPDARTVYVQFNHVGNKEDESIEGFARRLFAFVEANPVERFVLDLRLNRGGNGALNRPLLLGIIKSPRVDQRGRLFVLIGRSTWSAAQGLVNELEKYTNALFVGEPSGGKVNSYGDSTKIILPNSGITVRVSTLWWQEDERDRRPWTAPQVAADLTFEDYRTNNDPALKAALAYASPKSLPELLMEATTADEVAERFRGWRTDPVNAYADPEAQINGVGYDLIAAKRLTQAIEVFKLNVVAFPESANAHDSLAEAYLAKGDRDAAIRSYEKALALNPEQRSAIEALKRLRGN